MDVGCGPGTDTVRIAQIVGSTGLAVGIDHDKQMIAEAQERAQRAGVAAWTEFEATDAAAIPYKSNFFGAAYCERLFQHVSHPAAVLGEMVRVTRPQGRIVVADSDWATLSIDTTEVGIERRIVHALPGMLANGYAGRELLRLFRMYPLADVVVEVHPIVWRDFPTFWATSFSLPDIEVRLINSGVVSGEELKRFRASLASAQETGSFFAQANMVVVTGAKKATG